MELGSQEERNRFDIDRDLALKNFFRSAPMMMGIADLIGEDIRHVSDNEASGDFFDRSPGEMEGKLASDLSIPKEFISLWIKHYRKALSSGRPVAFEYTHDDGEHLVFSVVVSHMGFSPDGHPRFSYVVQDITRMRGLQDELRQLNQDLERIIHERTKELELQKNKFDCLLQSSPIGIGFLDRELRYEIINPALAKLNGKPLAQHIGRKVTEIIPSGEQLVPILSNIISSGESVGDREFQTEEGRTFLANYFPVKLEGEVVGIGATITEITERKNLEEELRLIANALPQIVWTATPEGFVDWYNDWWYEYTGAERGSNWDDELTPMHPDDVAPTWERWKQSLKTGEPYQMEYRFRRASDGQYRWHLGRANPIRDSQGKVIRWIGSNTDVHDQKELVKRLQEERAQRENFVATLSHDLRTPLTAAKISAQIIPRKLGDLNFVTKSALRISENMDRADLMIRNLLDVSRIRAGEKIPLDLGSCELRKLIDETIQELSTIHGDRFILKAPEEVIGIWSCSGIRRITENLCNNAIKYGAPDTPVTVCLDRFGEVVKIRVHNHGQHIPLSEQRQLFEPFHRSKNTGNSQRGWGLGLTLVKGLTSAHGGYVEVQSEEGQGTTFTVTLPIHISDGTGEQGQIGTGTV